MDPFFFLVRFGFCQFTPGRIGVARAFPVHASLLGVQFEFELCHDPLLLCLHIIVKSLATLAIHFSMGPDC